MRVDGPMSRSFRLRVVWLALVPFAVLAGGLMPSSVQAMTACEAIKPIIEHVGLTEMIPAGVVLEAQINPQNSATTYEFVIVQQLRNPENPSDRSELAPEGLRAVGGPIPAGAGDVSVSGLVTGLERGYTYWYEVVASNLAGETRSAGDNWFSYFYTGGFPNGLPGLQYRGMPPSPCELEIAKQEAERLTAKAEAERHQQAREHEELLAKEAAVRYASEAAALKQREEEEAAAEAKVRLTSACIVPSLKEDTLRRARQILREAHCSLGKVTKPRTHHGALVVIEQSAKPGKTLPNGARVPVELAVARHDDQAGPSSKASPNGFTPTSSGHAPAANQRAASRADGHRPADGSSADPERL